MRTPNHPVVCFGAATSVAIQRIESKGHWPSDVFLSAAFGTVVARTVVSRWERRMAEAETHTVVRVGFEPRGAGAALTLRF